MSAELLFDGYAEDERQDPEPRIVRLKIRYLSSPWRDSFQNRHAAVLSRFEYDMGKAIQNGSHKAAVLFWPLPDRIQNLESRA